MVQWTQKRTQEVCLWEPFLTRNWKSRGRNSAEKVLNNEIAKLSKADVESQVYTEFDEQFQALDRKSTRLNSSHT